MKLQTTQERKHPQAPGIIPQYPDSTALTEEVYATLIREIAERQAPTAELSYLTLVCWHGGSSVRVARCESFFLVFLAYPVDEVVVVGGNGHQAAPVVARTLLELCATHRVAYVPQETAIRLSHNPGLTLVLDRDNADYVFDPVRLASYDGPDLKGKRKLASRFARAHNVNLQVMTLASREAHDLLAASFDRWLLAKGTNEFASTYGVERAGIERWPRCGLTAERCRVFALVEDGDPIGVSVVEPMWAGTWMGVVFKTDPESQGATAFLRQAVSTHLLHATPNASNCRLNIQQDTGVQGLRAAKTSYRPLQLEPKFVLLPPTDGAP